MSKIFISNNKHKIDFKAFKVSQEYNVDIKFLVTKQSHKAKTDSKLFFC